MTDPQQSAAAAPLATTFRPEEVDAACILFAKISTGADIAILQRSRAVQSLYAKFVRLREKAREKAPGKGG